MKYQETVEAVNRIISEYAMPLTLRQIYYRLVVANLIPNRRAAYNGLSSQLVKAREEGEVDDTRITDRSRRIDDFAFDSPSDFLDAVRHTLKVKYVRRFWDTQAVYVEVWVEKDALSGVLSNAVKPLNTIVAPSRGYSSYSYLVEAARRFSYKSNETIVLHFADHDPSGLDMTRDLRSRFARYAGGVEVKRVALNFDQVEQYSLVPNPTKWADSRSGRYIAQYGDDCWELDAIEPNELTRLCREAVESEIDDTEAWETIKKLDKAERAQLMELVNSIEKEMEA